MTAQDEASRTAQRDRQPHIDERRRLNEFQLKVQAQDLKRQQLQADIEAARNRIKAFDETNAGLIAQAEQERLDIARDRPYKTAYDRFLEVLRSYRDQLPGQLMAGLNDAARDLYNAFNRNDRDEDKLSALHLPLTGEEKIEISFRGKSWGPRRCAPRSERGAYTLSRPCHFDDQGEEHRLPSYRFRRCHQCHRP
ncbi:hypothetical protein OGV25_14355 [Pseudomonas sp. P1B16]|uniref:hypothetical protein n=1 Tax=Pseudomonas sp. P1B16 TaxID=2986074 RepID=UPI002A23B910|nr:hypothetical protein [Pseudomonas sp. P1B16]WPM24551.1 hypothetical protein OGV25_14355 [Pseudomonas sp. P1B16]